MLLNFTVFKRFVEEQDFLVFSNFCPKLSCALSLTKYFIFQLFDYYTKSSDASLLHLASCQTFNC